MLRPLVTIHLWVSRGCWIALHDKCADVPLLQRERRGKPDQGPPSNDKYRYIYHSSPLPSCRSSHVGLDSWLN